MSKKQCPECKSEKVIPIHYGFIDDPRAIERIKWGVCRKVVVLMKTLQNGSAVIVIKSFVK